MRGFDAQTIDGIPINPEHVREGKDVGGVTDDRQGVMRALEQLRGLQETLLATAQLQVDSEQVQGECSHRWSALADGRMGPCEKCGASYTPYAKPTEAAPVEPIEYQWWNHDTWQRCSKKIHDGIKGDGGEVRELYLHPPTEAALVEPVLVVDDSWRTVGGVWCSGGRCTRHLEDGTKLYTHPPTDSAARQAYREVTERDAELALKAYVQKLGNCAVMHMLAALRAIGCVIKETEEVK